MYLFLDSALRTRFRARVPAHSSARPLRAASTPLPSSVDAPYDILAEIGSGSTGIVYRARDTRDGRIVALKFSCSDARSGAHAGACLLNEARVAAVLRHPNICSVHELGRSCGRWYLAMEYVEGETLQDRLQRGPLPYPELLAFAREIVLGLEAAHYAGVVHCDLKPANLLLGADGCVKVTDFGLARLDTGPAQSGRPGYVSGTPAYMAPEQMRGEEVNRRVDLWAFGMVLYEMAAGRRPFPGTYPQALFYSVLNTDPEPVSSWRADLPEAFEKIVDRCLKKSPSERYESATEILVDIDRLLQNLDSWVAPRRDPGP